MRSGKWPILFPLVCACALPAFPADPPSTVAIRNAKIFPVSAPAIERGTVVLRDGLIVDVGAQATVPAGAWVIDGEGLNVYPGLVDALSTWGIPEAAPAAAAATAGRGGGRPTTPAQPATPAAPVAAQPAAPARGPEDRPATTSWVMAADQVQPTERRIELARSAGFTTAVTYPKAGIIAGHGAVINLGGDSAGRMVLDPSGGLYLTMSGAGFSSFPGSLLGVIAYIRQVWIDADHYRLAKELYAKSPASIARPDYDRALEGVLAVRRVLLPANSLVQVERMLRFGKELGTPVVLYGGHEGYRAAEPLKKAGVPVILNVKWPARARDGDPEAEDPLRTLELRDKAPTTPAALAAAGVKFAVCSDGQDTPRDVLRSLKNSIDVGLKADDALRALTLSAAEIYGAANRLGSIEKGKIANLTVVKGDLFDNRSQVKMVFIDGVKYEPAPEAPAGPPSAGPPTRPSTPQEVIQ